MLKKNLFFIFFLTFYINIFSQDKSHTLSGYIMSLDSNELIIGANIVFPEIGTGTTTNSYGFYSITLPSGIFKIEISSIGFKTVNETNHFNRSNNTCYCNNIAKLYRINIKYYKS